MSPLAKSHSHGKYPNAIKGSEYLSERFELFINKKEIINAYSE
jgi:lysyl-tRNA synthetase class II